MKAPVPARNLAIEITYACGMRCVFCSSSETLECFHGLSIGLRDIVRILVAKKRDGVKQFLLAGGGEPTLHPRFLDVLRSAKRLGMQAFVISNGWRFADPSFARSALPLLDKTCFSIHGDSAELQDGLSGSPGSFDRLVRAFGHAREWGTGLLMSNIVVSRANWDRLEDIVRFILGQGVVLCHLAHLAPEGKGARDYARSVVPHALWRRKLPRLARLVKEAGAQLQIDGLPMCVLGELAEHSTDVSFVPTVWVSLSSKKGPPRLEECLRSRETRCRVAPAVCARCAEASRCGGVFDLYAETFGTADLRAMTSRCRNA